MIKSPAAAKCCRRRILIICSHAKSLERFRGDLICELVHHGFSVRCLAPNIDDATRSFITESGAEIVECDMQRTGLNPLKDLALTGRLLREIWLWKPHLLFTYTIKPVIYGGIAGRLSSVPSIPLISGLGTTFSGKESLLRVGIEHMYRFALKRSPAVIFQNKDDQKLFITQRLITNASETIVVPGSGINLDRFSIKNKKDSQYDPDRPVRFIMISRLILAKGLLIYLDAAREICSKHTSVEFQLLGDFETGKSMVEREAVARASRDGIVKHLGWRDDVREDLSNADVFVLPTYYREGIPRTLLEALSSGLAIITTDTPGCRQTVIDGENGYLIEPRCTEALVDAIEKILANAKQLKTMGERSREHAASFDVRLVNSDIIATIVDALDIRAERAL